MDDRMQAECRHMALTSLEMYDKRLARVDACPWGVAGLGAAAVPGSGCEDGRWGVIEGHAGRAALNSPSPPRCLCRQTPPLPQDGYAGMHDSGEGQTNRSHRSAAAGRAAGAVWDCEGLQAKHAPHEFLRHIPAREQSPSAVSQQLHAKAF